MSVVEWSVATRRARSFRLVNAVKRGRQLVSIIAFLRIFSFHFVLVSFRLVSSLVSSRRVTVYSIRDETESSVYNFLLQSFRE